jgi:predicted Zn-dependent protease with MMP-like domain
MERVAFAKVMQEVLDSLPEEFSDRIRNVAVLVEAFPPGQLADSEDVFKMSLTASIPRSPTLPAGFSAKL